MHTMHTPTGIPMKCIQAQQLSLSLLHLLLCPCFPARATIAAMAGQWRLCATKNSALGQPDPSTLHGLDAKVFPQAHVSRLLDCVGINGGHDKNEGSATASMKHNTTARQDSRSNVHTQLLITLRDIGSICACFAQVHNSLLVLPCRHQKPGHHAALLQFAILQVLQILSWFANWLDALPTHAVVLGAVAGSIVSYSLS